MSDAKHLSLPHRPAPRQDLESPGLALPSRPTARCAIAVMAKAPQPGLCKTRLVPPLSPEQAADMSAAFLRDVTENLAAASRLSPIVPFLAYAPPGLAHLFDGILAPGTGLLLADGGASLAPGIAGFGRCLAQAAGALLAEGFEAVCLLNSDSPNLPTEILCEAADRLLAPGDRAIMGPAEDGGYYILGMKAPHMALFRDIAWSTGQVAAATRERAREIGLELLELPTWYDVDDAASLQRLRRDLGSEVGYRAPASARMLARIEAARQTISDPPWA